VGGHRGVAKLLLVAGLLEAEAAAGCTGASKDLAADQCAAWGKFFDAAGGPNWTDDGENCSKEDPCACCPFGVGRCSVLCSAGSITQM